MPCCIICGKELTGKRTKYCAECWEKTKNHNHVERQLKYYTEHPEYQERQKEIKRAYAREYNRKHKFDYKNCNEEAKQKRREYMHKYYLEHKEELRAKGKIYMDKYRAEHADELLYKQRKRYVEHEQEIKEYRHKYYLEHKDKLRAYQKEYMKHYGYKPNAEVI